MMKRLLILSCFLLIAGAVMGFASTPYNHFGLDATPAFFLWFPLVSALIFLLVACLFAPLLRFGKREKE
jgi:ABC-type Na+ efflux pump permease subunit